MQMNKPEILALIGKYRLPAIYQLWSLWRWGP